MAAIFPPSGLSYEKERADRRVPPVAAISLDSWFVSEVVDNVAHFGVVLVMPTNGPLMPAIVCGPLGNGVMGVRNIGNTLPAHTKVVCFRPPGATFAYVMACVPDMVTDNQFNFNPDWLVMGSRVGVGFDGVHNSAWRAPTGVSGIVNYAAGSPIDSLPGDHGVINELGVGYGVGRAMAWLRASHFCGVEAFWLDNLLRLSGHNYELFTSAAERRALLDDGEYNDVERWGPYYWETLGLKEPNKDFTKHTSDDWNTKPGKAGREPIADDQMGIWRVQRFRGYLGDLERTIVALPLKTAITSDTEKLSNGTTLPGLLDVGFSADGAYHIRTAKGVLIEKSVTIPVPKEKHLPDDPLGDMADNYKAAGVWGEGKAHTKPDVTIENDNPGLRSLLAWERFSLLNNYYDNLSFVRHAKDWALADESYTLQAFGLEKGCYDPATALKEDEFWMPLPKSRQVDVDHRGKRTYYSGRACIQLDDDGSIRLEDAYGSQIRMEGGNIFIAARNDVVMQPGRNAQVWAPHDLVLKAGNSADLSASQGDVRVKAQGNLLLYAASKGVLIESGFDPSKDGKEKPDWTKIGEKIESRGVLVRAPNSSFVALTKDVYVRSGIKDKDATDGELHIDAGGGKGKTFIHGGDITQRAKDRIHCIVGSTGANEDTATLDLQTNGFVLGGKSLSYMDFGADAFSFGHENHSPIFSVHGNTFLDGMLYGGGNCFFEDTVIAGKSLMSHGTAMVDGALVVSGNALVHGIASDTGGSFLPRTPDDVQKAKDRKPPDIPGDLQKRAKTDGETLKTQLKETRKDANQIVKELLKELYGDDSKFASEALLKNATFSFRVPEEYGTKTGFKWYEARWQQLNRSALGVTAVWKEEPVTAPATGDKTSPYPGYDVWETEKAFVTVDSDKLFDSALGVCKPRATVEGDATLPTPTATTFASGYIVTLQKKGS